MRIFKQAVEAAAAAALATSFFAFPIGLAAMDPGLPVTTAAGGPERVVHIDAAGLLMLADADTAPAEPEAAPAPAEAEPAPETDAPADATPTEDAAPTPAPSETEALAPAPTRPLAVRTPGARKLTGPLALDADGKVGPKARKGRQKKCLEPDPRIQTRGGDKYAIDRDLVDAYTSDLKKASKLAWVGWHRDADGEIDGFRVKRIRCGSVLHQAGFRNGDVIHTVNGKPVTSIPQALSAYRKLRKKRILNVELQRKGEARKLRYRLS
jgi:hypothetical protein